MNERTYSHTGSAIVTVTVEIDVGSSWGSDCTVAQIFKQGEEEGVNALRSLILSSKDHRNRMRIIGHPVTKAVSTRREPTP